MRTSFVGLLGGPGAAPIVLVYLLIVVNFQSWLDPFIIISALPAALAGIVWMLFLTHTTLQRAVADRRDHVHGRRDRQQHSGRQLREGRAGEGRCAARRRARRRLHALPPGADDGAGDDHRHGADGARLRRRRRAERAARPRGDRRPGARDRRDAVLRAGGVRAAARPGARPASAHVQRATERRDRRVVRAAGRRRAAPDRGGRRWRCWGISSARAGAGRRHAARRASWPCRRSSVVAPERGAPQEEIVLPGTMQAFADAPIYARTDGYLQTLVRRHRRAACKPGQLLAEIDTPEIDQQLQQARADLATAEANARLAQIDRRALPRSDQDRFGLAAGPRQRQRQPRGAKGARSSRRRPTSKRLEQLQAFGKIDAPFDGVITARNTDVGALIDSGSNAQGAVSRRRGPPAARVRQRAARSTRARRGRG